MNFFIQKDELFDNLKYDVIMPLVFVQRDAVFTQAQASSIFSIVFTTNDAKLPGTIVGVAVGLILLALGIYMCMRSKRVYRQEELGIDGSSKKNVNDSFDKLI